MGPDDRSRKPGLNRSFEFSLRIYGLAAAVLYLVLGSAFIVVFFFVGQAAGFAETRYTLQFLLLVLYVYGTCALAAWLAMRPSALRGVVLTVLIVPYLVFSLITAAQS
jgi:hypothetical protein